MNVLHLNEEEAKMLAKLANKSLTPDIKFLSDLTDDEKQLVNYINQFCHAFGYSWNIQERGFRKHM